jgi:hypothetical protein
MGRRGPTCRQVESNASVGPDVEFTAVFRALAVLVKETLLFRGLPSSSARNLVCNAHILGKAEVSNLDPPIGPREQLIHSLSS